MASTATKKLTLLGSTGSIGTQTLSLVESLCIEIVALSGYANANLLEEQALRFRPKTVCAVDEEAARTLKTKLAHTDIRVLSGPDGLVETAAESSADTVLNAVVGIAGLSPTLAAIAEGKKIALANKETLVAGGEIVTAALKKSGGMMLPVDSEHSAIFQCMQASKGQAVKRIFLTASGGPFYGRKKVDLKNVSVDQALRHPNWSMGGKITIDSATLMNKGLELIEAMWLFSVPPQQVEIVIHRQSIVHSMVEFSDNAVIAQLSLPDMRIPIQYALTYPERRPSPVPPMTLGDFKSLTFDAPDFETFDCLAACKKAAEAGGLLPAVANAANERAVELFLAKRIGFLEIGEAVSRTVYEFKNVKEYTLEDVLHADQQTRKRVDALLARRSV